MGPLSVVVVDPTLKAVQPCVIGPVEPAVGPLGEEDLDEPLGLAVGLRPVRLSPLVAGADGVDRRGVSRALGVGPAVVGSR